MRVFGAVFQWIYKHFRVCKRHANKNITPSSQSWIPTARNILCLLQNDFWRTRTADWNYRGNGLSVESRDGKRVMQNVFDIVTFLNVKNVEMWFYRMCLRSLKSNLSVVQGIILRFESLAWFFLNSVNLNKHQNLLAKLFYTDGAHTTKLQREANTVSWSLIL